MRIKGTDVKDPNSVSLIFFIVLRYTHLSIKSTFAPHCTLNKMLFNNYISFLIVIYSKLHPVLIVKF